MKSAATSGELHPLRSDAPLIVYLDLKSPYAYLALEPAARLGSELGIAIDWRPLTLDIPSYLGSAKLDSAGRVAESKRTPQQWARVRYAYHDARRYARQRNLTIRGTVKIWDTSLAAIAMLWARSESYDHARRFLEQAYPPFWRREFDAEDLSTISHTLAASGVSASGFADWAAGDGLAAHERFQQAVFDAGIFGVPSFIVDGNAYFGREHLPYIRWLLQRHDGPAPDIAYAYGEGFGIGSTTD